MPTAIRPMPDQESSHVQSVQRARSYEGRGSPAKPSAARRSWPRWSSTCLFDEMICPPEHRRRNGQAKCFRGLEVDDELESCGLLNRQVGRPCTLQDLVHVMRRPPKLSVVAQAIGHESASLGEPSRAAHGRKTVLYHKFRDAVPVSTDHSARVNEDGIQPFSLHGGEQSV